MCDNEGGMPFLAEYFFGDYCLKFNEVLLKNGRVLPIPPKELQILSLLAAHAGRVLSKEFLIKTVWNGGVVSDESLTRCICSLRKILEKNGDACYIETIYGKGYAFASEISLVPSVNHDAKEMLAIFSSGTFTELAFIDVYEMFSACLPQKVNIYPYALLSKFGGFMDFEIFIKNHNPKYVVYYTLTDVDHNEKIINFSIKNRVDDAPIVWLTHEVSQLKEHSYTSFKHRIQHYFNNGVINNKSNQSSNKSNFPDKKHSQHSLVDHLIDDYSHSCLTTTDNIFLKNENYRRHHIDGIVSIAECYIGFILSGSSNIYKLIYKVRKMIEELLLSEPLNARALALMGVVKSIDEDSEHSHIYFSQANCLSPHDDFVIYHYALHFFLKGQYGLFIDEIQKISQSSAFKGRILFLKRKILTQQISDGGYLENKLHQASAVEMTMNDNSDETYHVYSNNKCNTLHIGYKKRLIARLNELKEISYHPQRNTQ